MKSSHSGAKTWKQMTITSVGNLFQVSIYFKSFFFYQNCLFKHKDCGVLVTWEKNHLLSCDASFSSLLSTPLQMHTLFSIYPFSFAYQGFWEAGSIPAVMGWGAAWTGHQRDRQPFMLAFTFTVHLESPEIIRRACKLHTELELVDLNPGPLLLGHDNPNCHTTVPLMRISLYSVCYVGYYCDCFF